jgi:hypothetical protein
MTNILVVVFEAWYFANLTMILFWPVLFTKLLLHWNVCDKFVSQLIWLLCYSYQSDFLTCPYSLSDPAAALNFFSTDLSSILTGLLVFTLTLLLPSSVCYHDLSVIIICQISWSVCYLDLTLILICLASWSDCNPDLSAFPNFQLSWSAILISYPDLSTVLSCLLI